MFVYLTPATHSLLDIKRLSFPNGRDDVYLLKMTDLLVSITGVPVCVLSVITNRFRRLRPLDLTCLVSDTSPRYIEVGALRFSFVLFHFSRNPRQDEMRYASRIPCRTDLDPINFDIRLSVRCSLGSLL